MLLPLFLACLQFSCSKDNDLLAEQLDPSGEVAVVEGIFAKKDAFSTTPNQPVVIDVLENDEFPEPEEVKIVEVSEPENGEVVINEDKTITYTPTPPPANVPPTEPTTDSFEYTTETTTEENEVVQEQATVTVTITPVSAENTYYVTVSGSSSNNGRTEAAAWSWSHAVANAKSGDLIYVKAGTYNNLSATFNRDGTASKPIRFVGYKTTPGDIDHTKQTLAGADTKGRRGSTVLAGGAIFDYKKTPSPSDMPYFTKAYVKNDLPAFVVNGDFVEIENVIVNGYDVAFRLNSSSQGAKIRNTITREQGNMGISMAHNGHPDRYNGTGYDIREASNFDVSFNTNLNSEQNAFQILGATNGTMTNNVVYSYNTANGTDYMFLLSSSNGKSTTGLTIEYNLVERNTNVPHGGHGFIAKNGANNNVMKNFHIINSSVEVNFTNVYENTFENGTIKGSFYASGDPYARIFLTNGAHHNVFKNIIVDGSWGGIASHDYNDGASSDPNIDSVNGGVNNFFVNIIVKNSQYGIIYSETGQSSPGAVKDNYYINCTFYDVEYGVRAYHRNENNKFYNCSFTTKKGLITNHSGLQLNSNTVFENCHFGGAASPGNVSSYKSANNIGGNALFSSVSGLATGLFNVVGLTLNSNSPLIGKGKNVSNLTPHAAFDFTGKARNNSYNIGAY